MIAADSPMPLGRDVPEDVYGSWSASPAPDGVHVAFVSDRTGEPRVWVEGPRPRELRPVPGAPQRVISVSWSPDGEWLACVAAAGDGSRHEVWVVRPTGADPRLVAGDPGSTADLGHGPWHGWSAAGALLVTETRGVLSSCLLIEPGSGARRSVVSEPLTTLLDVDAARRRALIRVGPRGARHLEVLDLVDGGRWVVTTAEDPKSEASSSTDLGGFTPDGRAVLAVSAAGRDLAALVRVELPAPGAGALAGHRHAGPLVVAEHPGAEVEDVVISDDGATAVVLWNVRGGTSAVSLVDLVTGQEIPIRPLPRSVVDDCRLFPGGKELLLTAESWSDPKGIWSVDLTTGAATPLSSRADGELHGSRGASTSVVDVGDLTRPQLLCFPARDGLELSGWLYRPVQTPGDGSAPTIVYLHGGPEAQERPVYNSLFQSLVAAGVAVFAANVRGSSGFGRAFLRADDRDLRFAAIDDVADCADHLVSSGFASSGRLGCMGRSYGGYLTLAALTWHPELFAVGVDVCGMADFATFYANTEPWIGVAAVAEYGHPVDDAELLRALSPIHRIDAIKAPLLVVHGSDDTNVPVEEAEQVVAALAERGVEHRYLCFDGEGHELVRTLNRVTFVRESVAWITRHLGIDGTALTTQI